MGILLWLAGVATLSCLVACGCVLHARRSASISKGLAPSTSCPPSPEVFPRWLNRALASVATVLLLALIPPGISRSTVVGDAGSLPTGILYEPPEARWLIAFGPIFPPLPLNVTVGKGIGGFGLRFDATPGAYVPPAALYWTPSLDESGRPAATTVFLGIVGGTRDRWVLFNTGSMRATGYWVLHAFDTNATVYYQARYSTKERHDE